MIIYSFILINISVLQYQNSKRIGLATTKVVIINSIS
uniref:Uncharacterized protein n=1 Tax=Arundo donax TaxID=35708 RepID=A0A0A9FPV0_ARUDO